MRLMLYRAKSRTSLQYAEKIRISKKENTQMLYEFHEPMAQDNRHIGNGEDLPMGIFRCRITDIDFGSTCKEDFFITWTLTVLDDPYKGLVFKRPMPISPGTLPWVKGELRAMGFTGRFITLDTKLRDFVGREVELERKIGTDLNGRQTLQNCFRRLVADTQVRTAQR